MGPQSPPLLGGVTGVQGKQLDSGEPWPCGHQPSLGTRALLCCGFRGQEHFGVPVPECPGPSVAHRMGGGGGEGGSRGLLPVAPGLWWRGSWRQCHAEEQVGPAVRAPRGPETPRAGRAALARGMFCTHGEVPRGPRSGVSSCVLVFQRFQKQGALSGIWAEGKSGFQPGGTVCRDASRHQPRPAAGRPEPPHSPERYVLPPARRPGRVAACCLETHFPTSLAAQTPCGLANRPHLASA